MPSVVERNDRSTLGAKGKKVLLLAKEEISRRIWNLSWGLGGGRVSLDNEGELGEGQEHRHGKQVGKCRVLGWVAQFVWGAASHRKTARYLVGETAWSTTFDLTCMAFSSRVRLSFWSSEKKGKEAWMTVPDTSFQNKGLQSFKELSQKWWIFHPYLNSTSISFLDTK